MTYNQNSGDNTTLNSPGATIGSSIKIKGEITGSEDLLIQGAVEGSVVLTGHVVTIGETALIKANVSAREIRVEGEVIGDLTSKERVVVRSTGKVKGNIMSPCLSLEEGARLKGSIDTDSSSIDDRVAVTLVDEHADRKFRPTALAHGVDTVEKVVVDNGQADKFAKSRLSGKGTLKDQATDGSKEY